MIKSNEDKRYKHITEVERYKNEGYLDAKKTTKEIAELYRERKKEAQ